MHQMQILIFWIIKCNSHICNLKMYKATKTHICRNIFSATYCQPSDMCVCHRCMVVSYKSDFFIILHISSLTEFQQYYNNTKSCHGLFRVSMTTLYCMSYSTDKAVIDTICLVMLFRSVSFMNINIIYYFELSEYLLVYIKLNKFYSMCFIDK